MSNAIAREEKAADLLVAKIIMSHQPQFVDASRGCVGHPVPPFIYRSVGLTGWEPGTRLEMFRVGFVYYRSVDV